MYGGSAQLNLWSFGGGGGGSGRSSVKVDSIYLE